MTSSSKINVEHDECVVCHEQNENVTNCPKCFHNGAICKLCKIKLPKYGFKQYQCITCKEIINDVTVEQHVISVDTNDVDTRQNTQNTQNTQNMENIENDNCKYIMCVVFASWGFSIPGYYLLATIFNLKYKYNFFDGNYKALLGIAGGFIIAMTLFGMYKLIKYMHNNATSIGTYNLFKCAYNMCFKISDT
jgi:hypothetical protein